jgi:hypothetical protein
MIGAMDTAYDRILERVALGTRLKTPDKAAGKPFTVESIDLEGIEVRTSRGGKVKMGLFVFDTAIKYLTDLGIRGERWLPVKDEGLQMLLNSENDRVRASSYVISILEAAGMIDVVHTRPNKVRLSG